MKKKNQTTVIVIIVISVLTIAGVLIWGFTSNWGQGKSSSQTSSSQKAASAAKEKTIDKLKKELNTLQENLEEDNFPSINGHKHPRGCAGAVYGSGALSQDYCENKDPYKNKCHWTGYQCVSKSKVNK